MRLDVLPRSSLVQQIGAVKVSWMGDGKVLDVEMLDGDLDGELDAARRGSEPSMGTSTVFFAHTILLCSLLEVGVRPS